MDSMQVQILIFLIIFLGIFGTFIAGVKMLPQNAHQETDSKERLMLIVSYNAFIIIGMLSIFLETFDNIVCQVLCITLPIATLLVACFVFGKFFLRIREWKRANPEFATLFFKEETGHFLKHDIIIISVDGAPKGTGVLYWQNNKCMIAPGKHHIRLKSREIIRRRTGEEMVFFVQEINIELLKNEEVLISEDSQNRCLHIRSLNKECHQGSAENIRNFYWTDITV